MSQVSVIIPTWNRRQVLKRALDSVLRQDFTDWELIVIDDGSTDATEEFFAEWLRAANPTQRVVFRTVENGGVSRARNLAAGLAESPWLAFLDSDDEWLPDKLQKQMALTAHFRLIHGEEIWIRRGVRVNAMKKHAKAGGRLFTRCVDLCCISPSTAMIERALFLQADGFREDFPVCEDFELWLRLCAHLEVGFVPTPVTVKHGGHPDQLSLTHRAMDEYRVRALLPFLNDSTLALGERHYVAENVVKRAEILVKGFEKHGHAAKAAVAEEWRQSALNALTQIHSAHSVAERLPRSEDKLSL